mmetsp:Transcript_18335/g.22750  ORF Transcript_18335/g.22750 Transcript_18335/m.22750 type:complete len:816 (+) Transcript_18335:647-3094(+)
MTKTFADMGADLEERIHELNDENAALNDENAALNEENSVLNHELELMRSTAGSELHKREMQRLRKNLEESEKREEVLVRELDQLRKSCVQEKTGGNEDSAYISDDDDTYEDEVVEQLCHFEPAGSENVSVFKHARTIERTATATTVESSMSFISQDQHVGMAKSTDSLGKDSTTSTSADVGTAAFPLPFTYRPETDDHNNNQHEHEHISNLESTIKALKMQLVSLQNKQESLQKDFELKNESLDSAKKIIASLEVANREFVATTKSNLKAKDTEIWSLKIASAVNTKTTDTLKSELETLKKEKDVKNGPTLKRSSSHGKFGDHRSESQPSCNPMNHTINGNGNSNAMCGAMNNNNAMSTIVKQVSDKVHYSFLQFCETDSCENQPMLCMNNEVADLKKRMQEQQEQDSQLIQDLKTQLEQKISTVTVLEDALQTQQMELDELKVELELLQKNKDTELIKYQCEVEALQKRCSNQLEQLADKDRDINKLKSKLQTLKENSQPTQHDSDPVQNAQKQNTDNDNNDTSSISSTGTKDNDLLETLEESVKQNISLNAELAVVMAEKEKIQEELRQNAQNLANAKMIISSLEKANNDKVEDLKAKITESGAVINDLVHKSATQEEITDKLRTELEAAKKTLKKAEKGHETKLKKMREDAIAGACKLAAQEREIHSLRQLSVSASDATTATAEGTSSLLGVSRASSPVSQIVTKIIPVRRTTTTTTTSSKKKKKKQQKDQKQQQPASPKRPSTGLIDDDEEMEIPNDVTLTPTIQTALSQLTTNSRDSEVKSLVDEYNSSDDDEDEVDGDRYSWARRRQGH